MGLFTKDDIIIAIYIGDFLICDIERKEINKVKDAFKAKFHMSNLGPVLFSFEMAVTQYHANKIFCLGQQAYLVKILKDHGI